MPHKGKSGHRKKSVAGKNRGLSTTKVKLKLKKNIKQSTDKNLLMDKERIVEKKDAKLVSLSNIKHEFPEQVLAEDKSDDPRFRRKGGRIILRNLPFQVTDDSLRSYLEKYGLIDEINILRKPDGKLVGCGFVQFASRKCAQKAILECNAKPFLGRTVIFDWAVPKNVFKEKFKPPPKIENIEVKSEEAVVIKKEKDEEKEMEGGNEEVQEMSSVDEDGEDSYIDEMPRKDGRKNKKERMMKQPNDTRRSSKPSHDDSESEGCTVFLKNLSFETTNEDLKEFMESFGSVHYALVCRDPLTEHSRGTAFVKFKNKESAEKCLSSGSEDLTLDGSVLTAMLALSREEAKRKVEDDKKKTPKDLRNLYLTKEGVIVAGTKAATGVSVSDMAKRVKLDQWKAQILKNLNMFVSRYRLVIHNLPPEFNDRQIRRLFLSNAGPDGVITEAKVMRDMKKLDNNGLGQSKGYGFITFTKHENALAALRNINNNPDIFTPDKRPIVAFSIENRAILNAKKKRLLKSQAMNPLFQQKNKSNEENAPKKGGKKKKTEGSKSNEIGSEETVPSFGGLTSKPGKTKLRLRNKFQSQIKTHADNLKAERKKKKTNLQKTKLHSISDGKNQASQEKKLKRKSNFEDAEFMNLVKKYKTKLTSAPHKWYESEGT